VLSHRQVALKHNIGVWYASLYQASAASATLLYVTNTTNGGSSSSSSSSSSRGAGMGMGGSSSKQTRRVTVTDAVSGATKTVRASPFAAGAHGATLRAEARGAAAAAAAAVAAASAAAAEEEEEEGGDDDGYHHTHSSLVGFDLASGEIVEGPIVLGADGKTPVAWMNALDSAL